MTMKPLRSIRARVTATFMLFIAVLLSCCVPAMVAYSRHVSDRRAERLLQAAARKVQREFAFRSASFADILDDERDITGENLVALIVDPEGHILEKSTGKLPPWPGPPRNEWRITRVPIGKNTAVIALHWRHTEETIRYQTLLLCVFGIVIFLCTGAGAWAMVGRTLAPIRQVAQQAHAVSVEQFQVYLSPSSQDAEIIELVTTLNDLLDRLAQSTSAKARFYAAASHELRTPLQTLAGHLELALTRTRTDEEYRSIIRKARAQTQRLTCLVRDLLLIHQMEAMPLPPREVVDLADICERCLANLSGAILSGQVHLWTRWGSHGELYAPPTHIEMLVRNLIENAVLYTEPGGQIEVEYFDGENRLEIRNDCAFVPDHDIQQWFEPLVRGQSGGRAKPDRNGLGLAICKAIAAANGWTISLHYRTGQACCRIGFGAASIA